MWTINGIIDDEAKFLFGELTPYEELCYYDGPLSFTLYNTVGKYFYGHWIDTNSEGNRYLIVPTTPETISDLKKGKTTITEALDQQEVWIYETGVNEYKVYKIDSIRVLPEEMLPNPDVTLIPLENSPKTVKCFECDGTCKVHSHNDICSECEGGYVTSKKYNEQKERYDRL